MKTQLELNQEVLITIKKIGINGEGIGYYKRQAVFVDGVIPPEEVVVKIKTLKRGYAEAEVVRVKKKAFYRTKPFCKHYGTCGGCQLQHVEYEEQLRLKEDLLKQAFERYTTLDLEKINFRPFNPLVKPRNYRYKAQMPVRNTTKGLTTGLYKKKTNELVDVLDCPVQDTDINRINQRVLELCDDHAIYAFDPKEMKGLLRYIVTRKSSATGEMQVTLVVTIYNHALKSAAKEILELENVVSVAISKNHDAKNHEVFGDTFEVLAGEETIQERMGDVVYALNPKAFYQLNPEEAHKMYDYINTLFDEEDKSLVDLYTGSGAIALYFAKRFERVLGIDLSQDSINAAKHNAKLNKFTHVDFKQGDAYEVLKAALDKKEQYDTVIFDPPRSGLNAQIIDLLLRSPFKKVIYVSCNPSTLAKNIKPLSRKYKVKSVMPFDMFPQTSHVESVTLLELKK